MGFLAFFPLKNFDLYRLQIISHIKLIPEISAYLYNPSPMFLSLASQQQTAQWCLGSLAHCRYDNDGNDIVLKASSPGG